MSPGAQFFSRSSVHQDVDRRTDTWLLVVIAVVALGFIANEAFQVAAARRYGPYKTDCAINLNTIGDAARTYADEHGGAYPWVATGTAEERSLAALSLLYEQGYVDDPGVFMCRAALTDGRDASAEPIPDVKLRAGFRLASKECSFVWRNRPTSIDDGPRTPLAADKRCRPGDANHEDGVNVLFKGGWVFFYSWEKLARPGDPDAARIRAELPGLAGP
jgi:hypothetical protein